MRNSLIRAKTSQSGFAAVLTATIFGSLALAPGESRADLPAGYTGKPYKDSILEVPGRLRLFRFDEGTKGQTWFDIEGNNKWYCKLREPAAVGLQLMGAGGDKWEPGKAEPGMTLVQNDCYMAQTNTGDWTKYTVRVKEAGTYSLNFQSSANSTNIPFVKVTFLDGTDSATTGQVTLPLTSYFHNWVYAKNIASIPLKAGLQVMRFDIVGNGPMNINFIDFALGTVSLDKGRADGSQVPGIRRALRLPYGALQVDLAGVSAGSVDVSAFDLAGKVLFSEATSVGSSGLALVSIPAGLRGLVVLRARQGGAWSESRPVVLGE